MRRGCVIVTVLVALGIVIGGYLGYRYVRDTLEVSQDLAAFSNRDTVLMQIVSKAPAPSAGERLTPERVGLYVGALDSVNTGWHSLITALDSVRARSDSGGTMGAFSTWANKSVLREIIRLPLVTRRSLVNYLNEHHLSWGEYGWLKERAVAASMITQAEYDSAMKAGIRSHLPSSGSKKDIAPATTDELFTRVGAIRSSGLLDSTEIAMMAPYRTRLLTTGIASLIGLDTDLDNKLDIGFDTADDK